jgi:hypothetical protein
MNADTDYQRIVDLLTKQHLAPYVAYDARDSIKGLGNKNNEEHIVVRVSDGKVVSGTSGVSIDNGSGTHKYNPITNPVFDPKCYKATGEAPATYNGADAVKFTLAATCKERDKDAHDYPFTTLYADARNLVPIDATGVVVQTEDNKGVDISVEQQFALFEGRVLPSMTKIDINGSGVMFWLQLHVRETYDHYTFMNSPS